MKQQEEEKCERLGSENDRYTTLLIAQAIEKFSRRVEWEENKVEAMVDYLYKHQAEAGKGGFKLTTFNYVAEHIAPC